MRLRSLLASASLLATTLTGAVAASPAQAAVDDPAVARSLAAEVESGRKVRAIIELRNGTSLAAVADAAEQASATTKVIDRTSSKEFLVASLDQATLDQLKTDDRIKAIYKDELSAASLDVSTKLIGSDRANKTGWTGKGATVAIIDTGIDRDHPFFAGRIVNEACFSTVDSDPAVQAVSLCPNGQPVQTGSGAADAETPACVVQGTNRCAHGSHVAGIAAGKKTGNAPSNGVAPAAGILPIQVFTRFNGPICGEMGVSAPCFLSYTSDQKLALQYVDSVHAGYKIVAANLSLGGGPKQTKHCDSDPSYGALRPEIVWLQQFGVATVVASGNNSFADGVSSPACISRAIAVGATDDADAVASFGNRGTLLDFFAPGMGIDSSVPNNRYDPRNGTSMSAPHVTGALALMRQAYPNVPMDKLVEKLQTTGKGITYTSAGASVTTKRIDVGKAVPYVADPTPPPPPTATPTATSTPSGTPTPSPTATPTPSTGPTDPGTDFEPAPVPTPDYCERGKGAKPRSAKAWAKEMLRGKGSLTDQRLSCYIAIAQNGSKVFPELADATTLAKAYKILGFRGKAAKALLDRELLAAWLNYAHGVHNGSAKVHGKTTLKQAIVAAERHRTGKATSLQLKKAAVFLYRHVNK
ncbi:S8 family peptidase [Nonomuraea sp. LPB2021202275-12-8]|uniref:S8 family peptidase n=1 Tax=Nonomuraea sp. LPB2021202275-12-8 TaxID=3120159 RepID=UPI00300CCFBF